jgi:N-acetyl-alpha-D-glucosaminyl L-malate synthase BshA
MKIAMVCYPTFGGSGIVATELGIALASRGHEVHFISYSQPQRLDSFRENVFFHEVDSLHYPLFEFDLYTLALAGKIIDVAKYEKIDILHVHYAIPHAVSGFLAREIVSKDSNMKLITTLHGTDITLVGLEPSFQPLVKFSLEQSDAITAVSKYLADKTMQNFDITKPIDVIPNFVDTKLFNRDSINFVKTSLCKNCGTLLVHISNFRPVKRVCDTIKILKKVRETNPAKLILIGDGPDRAAAEKLARDLDMTDHVKFYGKQAQFMELLAGANFFLLPSQSESFGLAALEAMSLGVPVVASNIGGIPEVVAHSETGYVAELGDTDRMAKYIVDLINDPKRWAIFSANSRKRALEKFDTENVVTMYEDLYKRVAGVS